MSSLVVLFDWDGCLCDTLSAWMEAYKKAFALHKLNPSEKEIVESFGDWEGATKLGVSDQKLFDKQLVELVDETMNKARLHAGVKKGLEKLNTNGVKMAVVTSSLKELLVPSMEMEEIGELFEFIIDAKDVTRHKPDPEPIIMAVDKLGVERKQVVYIGDTTKDVEAARNAKVKSILFYPELNQRFYDRQALKAAKPDFIVESFDDVVEVLLDLPNAM